MRDYYATIVLIEFQCFSSPQVYYYVFEVYMPLRGHELGGFVCDLVKVFPSAKAHDHSIVHLLGLKFCGQVSHIQHNDVDTAIIVCIQMYACEKTVQNGIYVVFSSHFRVQSVVQHNKPLVT